MPPTDNNNFFGIKVSKFGVPVNQANDDNLVYKDDFSTKTYFDNTTARIVEGLLPDSTYGMWVSQPGIDVRTANPNLPGNLVFNSNQDIFKIANKFTSDFSVTSGSGSSFGSVTITINHNLGYTPLIQSFVNITTVSGGSPGLYPLPYLNLVQGGGTTNVLVVASAVIVETITSTQAIFSATIQAGTQTIAGTLICYVLQETIL